MNVELIENIKSKFKEKFESEPVIVSAPGRINLIGGHTDYNEGFVLPAAINKVIISAIQKSSNLYCSAFAYNKNEAYEFNLNNIQPIEKGNWKNYVIGVVAEIQKLGLNIEPFNIVFGGDIPDGAGLSSSAALENSVVFGLNEVFNLNLTKSEMILISQKAEHNYVGVKCGIMDQYASMFGVENSVLLLDCRSQESIPLNIQLDDYELILINTHVSHNLSENAYNDRRNVCEKVAKIIGVKALRDARQEDLMKIKDQISEDDYEKALYIIQEIERTQLAAKAIKENNLQLLGQLLFEAHEGLKTQFQISCKELDFLIDKAKENPNVLGSRMMGGGFGGCTINIVAKGKINLFIEDMFASFFKEFKRKCSIEFVKLSKGTYQIK